MNKLFGALVVFKEEPLEIIAEGINKIVENMLVKRQLQSATPKAKSNE